MLNKIELFLVPAISILFLQNCARVGYVSEPAYAVGSLSPQKVHEAVIYCLHKNKWHVVNDSPETVLGEFSFGTHMFQTEISYFSGLLMFRYADSVNMNHRYLGNGKAVIHKYYNAYVRRLLNDIKLVLAGRIPILPITDESDDNYIHSNTNAINDMLNSYQSGVREFTKLSLDGAELKDRDLSGIVLRMSSIKKANLTDCNFSGADLRGSNFNGSDLTGANFTGADLRGTGFKGANLKGVDLTTAKLGAVSMTIKHNGGKITMMGNTNFSEADMSGSNLENIFPVSIDQSDGSIWVGASFEGTNLTNADMRNANMSHVMFRRAILTNADLRGADLKSAYLPKVIWDGAKYDSTTKFEDMFDPKSAGLVEMMTGVSVTETIETAEDEPETEQIDANGEVRPDTSSEVPSNDEKELESDKIRIIE